MREKKTEVMTIRVTSKTKSTIEREAEKREWTPSKWQKRSSAPGRSSSPSRRRMGNKEELSSQKVLPFPFFSPCPNR